MNTLLSQFNDMLKRSGKAATIDNIDTKVIFKEYNDTTQSTDYKYILTNPVDLIKQGSYINSLNCDWLAISKPVNYNGAYDKTIIRKINYTVKFNFTGNVKQYKCIVDTQSFDIQTGQYVNIPVGKILVTMQYNADSKDIVLGQRFYFASKAYKVSGIDRASEGLIILYCDLDSIDSTYDDITNEIADRWRYETAHTYVVNILTGDTTEALLNDVTPLIYNTTDNGTITNPTMPITFSSSNPSVCSVDNNGKILGNDLGVATVTAQLTYKSTVKDTIQVTVVETINHSYTVTIIANSQLKQGGTSTYTAHIYDNGVEVTNQTVVWSIKNVDGTTSPYASITASTGNGCTVKALGSSTVLNKVVRLTATLNATNPPTLGTLDITIKSAF